MDLRSIINSDSNPPKPRQELGSPIKQLYSNHQQSHQSPYSSPSASFHEVRHETHRPQPPPLQAPGPRDLQSPSASYSQRLAQSPYQTTPTSSLSQYPFPQATNQSQAQGPPGLTHQQREQTTTFVHYGGQYGQPSPPVITPTGAAPGGTNTHPQYHRTYSSNSSATPTSAQSHVQTFPRDSPHTTYSQATGPSQPRPPQSYQSQPGTPLGPPPPGFGRPDPIPHRGSSGPYPYDHFRSLSTSSHGNSSIPLPSPTTDTTSIVAASPSTYASRPPVSQSRSYITDEERERSLSVSPKTRLPSQTKIELKEVTQAQSRSLSGGVTPAKRKLTDGWPEANILDHRSEQERNHVEHYHESGAVNGSNNAPRVTGYGNLTRELFPGQGQEQGRNYNITKPSSIPITKDSEWKGMPDSTPSPTNTMKPVPYDMSRETEHSDSRIIPTPLSSSTTPSRSQPQASQSHSHQTPTSQTSPTPPSAGNAAMNFLPSAPGSSALPHSVESTASPGSVGSPQQPTRKRQRFDKPPVFAQSRKGSRGGTGNPLLPSKRPDFTRATPPVKQEALEPKENVPYLGSTHVVKEESNGYHMPSNNITLPKAQPTSAGVGALGPWEPSILNITPQEELTRIIADFLFAEVVSRKDIGAGPTEGLPGSGAILEIEAKIGQLIDRTTNERLRLPVITECIVSKNDPNLRLAFKSSMTEAQHRTLNQFLNKAVQNSVAPNPVPRIPLTYVHTRERDSFYELSQSAELSLPQSVRAQMNPRHNRAKVRITTDQKTGKELAKIMKVRVADLDVHSPRTPFDWRISVNLEMNFQGNLKDLVEVTEHGKRAPERNKDRMTYRHLAYQIDLTQVTPAEVLSSADKEHELEIELNATDVRKQGNLLLSHQPNGYEELIRGFVDNVRMVIRPFS